MDTNSSALHIAYDQDKQTVLKLSGPHPNTIGLRGEVFLKDQFGRLFRVVEWFRYSPRMSWPWTIALVDDRSKRFDVVSSTFSG